MSAATEQAPMFRCLRCGQVVRGERRCGCGSSRLRELRGDELRAWAALELDGGLSAEGRLRAVMVRCPMEE